MTVALLAPALLLAAAPPEQVCTSDRTWCATLADDEAGQPELRITAGPTRQSLPLPALSESGGFDTTSRHLWPQLVSAGAGSYLVGVITEEHTAYSGGGAYASTLTLYRVGAGSGIAAVLVVPWDSGSLIRACFSERDYRQRAGACHDEYTFTATLTAAGDRNGNEPPELHYRTTATSFPGRVSRQADSLAAGRLRRSDLVRVKNPECSFSRSFRFDRASRAYQPDRPLPADCTDFTEL